VGGSRVKSAPKRRVVGASRGEGKGRKGTNNVELLQSQHGDSVVDGETEAVGGEEVGGAGEGRGVRGVLGGLLVVEGERSRKEEGKRGKVTGEGIEGEDREKSGNLVSRKGGERDKTHLHLDLPLPDVHPHLQTALLDQRRVDLDPVPLQRGHAMRRNSDFPPLRQTASVAVTDGGEVESVGVLGEGGVGGHLCLELGDGNADDGSGELGRVDHHGVVLVVVSSRTLSVDCHGGIRIPRRDCCSDPRQPLDTLIQRDSLELVHELVSLCASLARLSREEVGPAGGGGGLLSLSLRLEG